jgi:hypothetical protein
MNNINFCDAPYDGAEMLPFERYSLYNWVVNIIKPNNILEVGTGVGGSTYFLSKALEKINLNGKIYTCDPQRSPCDEFFKECNNVIFKNTYSSYLIKEIIDKDICVDYIFFDGPENENVAIEDIKILESHIKPGTYFSMHDWEIVQRGYDNGISIKAKKIRPYMEESQKWKLIEIFSGIKKNSNYDNSPFDSVGLCLYYYNG